MEDLIHITPTIIRRVRHAERRLDVVAVPEQESGEQGVLVFMNRAQAETFRSDTGSYPVSEGFGVATVELEDLATLCAILGFELVALRGPEPEAVSFMDVGKFCEILELGEMAAELGLPERQA
jgi:hypothetical protein